jgi:hypothetical protein
MGESAMPPIFLYHLVVPRHPFSDELLHESARYIDSKYPAYRIVRKIDRCRPGPLRQRRAFSAMLKHLKWCSNIVLPSRLALFGTTREELESLFAEWSESRVWMDVLWDDETIVSTVDERHREWLLANWAGIEESCREELARYVEEPTQESPTPKSPKVDQRDAVLPDWLVRMKDGCGVPYDRLYNALWTKGIHRPNGTEYSRGAVQRRVEMARAQRKAGEQPVVESEVIESSEVTSLRLKLREIEHTKLTGSVGGDNQPSADESAARPTAGQAGRPARV